MRRALGIVATIAFLGGCAGGTANSGGPTVTAAPPIGSSPVVSPSATNAASDLVGSWHRAQTCQEMLAAFERAGLAKSHVQSLTGNFYGGSPAPTGGDVCEGARGPLEHSHFFTASGAFGSHDENGQQVDDGNYVAVDANTLAFPSHATEFGYAGDLVVVDRVGHLTPSSRHRRRRAVAKSSGSLTPVAWFGQWPCGTPNGLGSGSGDPASAASPTRPTGAAANLSAPPSSPRRRPGLHYLRLNRSPLTEGLR